MTTSTREWYIGIDVGGTNLRFALVGGDGRIIVQTRIKTAIHDGLNAFCCRLKEGIDSLCRHASREGGEVAALGAGVPGLIANDGYVHRSVNLPPLDGVNLRETLEHLAGLPSVVANDVNAFAWGEKIFGAGRGVASFLMVTLGTGVGGGLVLDGRLWTGIDGIAGEFGHMTMEPDGLPCPCGNRGCLEQYASATAIARAGRQLRRDQWKGADTESSLEPFSAKAIAAAADQGDREAAALFAEAGRYLGIATASVANLLNIEAIIIGGGVANRFDLLRDALESEVRTRAFPVPARRLKVLRATLGEEGGLLGSAALAMTRVRDTCS